MDAWLEDHLQTFITEYVWFEHWSSFSEYAHAEYEYDPTIIELGWPSLYRAFQRSINN